MKKTVFEGKVNGQVFDNVNDYNACLQAMIDMGQDVEASSNTKIVEVDEPCECCCKNKSNKPLKACVDFLPGFETNNDNAYIDNVVDDCDEVFNKKYHEVMDVLTSKYKQIAAALPNNTLEQKEVYLAKVRSIIGKIDADFDKNNEGAGIIDEKIDALTAELDHLHKMKTSVNQAADIINMYGDFYDCVEEMVVDSMYERPYEEQAESPKIETKEVVKEEPVAVNLGGFENLLKAVFGK